MLTPDEFDAYGHRLNLSTVARALMQIIRTSPPSRRVHSAAGNVSVRYPSRKMGVTIQAESHKNELAGIYAMEFDPGTLEYYDQPPAIKLKYVAKNGKPVGVLHTPDFFVLRTTAAGWEEWKMESELVRLSHVMPNRYCLDAAGHWRCPPGETYAALFGLFYRLRSSAEVNWILQRNLRFLEDYLRDDCPPVETKTAQAILRRIESQPGLTFLEVLEQTKAVSRDALYSLIATGQVYVDLARVALMVPERVRLFRDQPTGEAYDSVAAGLVQASADRHPYVCVETGARVLWDGQAWKIANAGERHIGLLNAQGSLHNLPIAVFESLVHQGEVIGLNEQSPTGLSTTACEILARASPDDLAQANRIYHLIEPLLAGQPPPDTPASPRSLRHWTAKYRAAEKQQGCGYVGLIPHRETQGNHRCRLPEPMLKLMDEVIESQYETPKQKRKFEAYGELVRLCQLRGLDPPSYKTFAKAIQLRPTHAQVKKRQGKRAAYPHEPFFLEVSFTTPRHGTLPFEIGHIDHTELDIELVDSQTGHCLGRPWATFLMDAYSRRLLAVYLTFDPPSYRSCMMVLRECVRRHRRLPRTIVVDGGREFESLYFETLLARYECAKKTRPGAKPRFGSVCERLFGTTNTMFVHNLLGNTQSLKNVRQVTPAVDPKTHAVWALGRLYVRLGEWAYEVYDTRDHPALGQSPREAYAAGLAQGGMRLHRLIPYDELFIMMTLPTVRKGTAKVQPNLGVKLNAIYYWADAFRDAEVEGLSVPVRYDPFDAGSAYAHVKGRWVHCVSEHYACFAGRSEKELLLATAELRQRSRNHTRKLYLTARKLAEFLASLEAEEALLQQRLRDKENRAVRHAIHEEQTQFTDPRLGRHASASVVEQDTDQQVEGNRGATLEIPEDEITYADY